MKLLLTSSGITNTTLKKSLQELCDKPFNELSAVFIPTAATGAAEDKSWLIENLVDTKNCGFKNLDIIDIAALHPENWQPRIERADVIFMGGGNTFFLMWWLTESGLQSELPKLLENKVYVGISAGSMVLGPRLDIPNNETFYPGESNEMNVKDGLKLVDFCVLPHYNSGFFTNLREEAITRVAKEIAIPTYAIDDQTAIRVDGEKLDIVGSGKYIFINE